MGHIRLSIADIEFVGTDPQGTEELLLDDDDVVLIEERRPSARQCVSTPVRRRSAPLPAPYSRVFDDAQTRVFPRDALSR